MRRIWVLALLLPILAGCGVTTGQTRPQGGSPAAMRKEPFGPDYVLVPEPAIRGLTPRLQAAGTRYGVLLALPPGYAALPKGERAKDAWTVYLGHPEGAKQNLLAGGQLLATLPEGIKEVRLAGVTGAYALLVAQGRSGSFAVALLIAGKGKGRTRRLGPVAKGFAQALAVGGWAVFVDPSRTLHAVELASGREETLAGVPRGTLVYDSFTGVAVGTRALRIPGMAPMPQPTLPAGFQWLHVHGGADPIAAAPRGWTVEEIPGGSSQGVTATDPNDGRIQVTAFANGCAGCYNPGFMAKGVDSLSTPFYTGVLRGTTPLGEHGFISRTTLAGGLRQYSLIADYLGGGDLEVSVTVPRKDAALAMEILRTVRLPW